MKEKIEILKNRLNALADEILNYIGAKDFGLDHLKSNYWEKVKEEINKL